PPAQDWPKMRLIRARFETALHAAPSDVPAFDAALLDLLYDEETPDDHELPETGVGLALERVLAPIFIRGETYGTRSSTLAYRTSAGHMTLLERRFGPNAVASGETRWSDG
ncbi:MAG TPA: NRDE family protein, partial [Rudaea sp.]